MLRLNCKPQNYAWGRLGSESLVARIHTADTGIDLEKIKSIPFAELWLGDHVNAPASVSVLQSDSTYGLQVELLKQIDSARFGKGEENFEMPINDMLEAYPEAFLGKDYIARYPWANGKLVFLFKVLSIRTALSIQAHPNREMAEKLHAEHPDIYKDPNPKPEIAIALSDDFEACLGFTDEKTILQNFSENPILLTLAKQFEVDFSHVNAQVLEQFVKKLFLELDSDKDRLQHTIYELEASSKAAQSRSPHQDLCLRLIEQYGRQDIGIVFVFLMNILKPKRGEWFLIEANVPHSYIQGEIMECMINSDNVVRGGLTPKLKDVKTLCSILPFGDFGKRDLSYGKAISPFVREFLPAGFDELRVFQVEVPPNDNSMEITLPQLTFCGILIVISGSCSVSVNSGDPFSLATFSSWYILPGSTLAIKGTKELNMFIASPRA